MRFLMMLPMVAFTVYLIGCVTVTPLTTQYATMKLIERGHVSAEEVTEGTAKVRTLVTGEGTLEALGSRVREVVGYSQMLPSDRLLVDAILGDIAHRLDIGFDSPITEAQREAILESLDSIDRVASLY